MKVLRADPDTDTVRALEELATLEVFAGSPDADRLTAEALILGQALGVGSEQLAGLFLTRGIYLCTAGRRPEGVAFFREGARLATQSGDNIIVGRALLNLSDGLASMDPAAAAEAARTAATHLRRAGARDLLAAAITNLVQALLLLGDWDAAQAEFDQALGPDGLADDYLTTNLGWLMALRGDAATAGTLLADLRDLRASEDLQDKSLISVVEAFTAAARRQPEDALSHARGAGLCGRPGDKLRDLALGLAAGRARRLRAAGHRRYPRADRHARLLPARTCRRHAAGRARPGPSPAGRQ